MIFDALFKSFQCFSFLSPSIGKIRTFFQRCRFVGFSSPVKDQPPRHAWMQPTPSSPAVNAWRRYFQIGKVWFFLDGGYEPLIVRNKALSIHTYIYIYIFIHIYIYIYTYIYIYLLHIYIFTHHIYFYSSWQLFSTHCHSTSGWTSAFRRLPWPLKSPPCVWTSAISRCQWSCHESLEDQEMP